MPEAKNQAETRWLVDKIDRGETPTETDLTFLADHLQIETERFRLCNLFYCCRRIGDAAYAWLIEPHLSDENVDIAGMALWTLCWLGQAERLKPYMLQAIDIGFARDPLREIGRDALGGAGLHLKTHRDRDFAQMLIRWAPPEDLDGSLGREPPPGMHKRDLKSLLWNAGKAMGVAVGADPEDLLYEADLYAACVKRFIAERQDG